MTDRFLTLSSDLDLQLPESYVLVIGGVSRQGNRRARRFIKELALENRNIVWLDGFEEVFPDSAETRVPIGELPGGTLTTLGYRNEESSFLPNRLARWIPSLVYGFGSRIATWLGNSSRDGLAHMGRRIRRVSRRVGNAVHKPLDKLASASRGYAGYRVLRPRMQMLRDSPPVLVLYCDDFALTTAWHAARLWPDVPVVPEPPAS